MDGNLPEGLFVNDSVEYMETENTTYEIVSKYTGKVTLIELLEHAIKRDIESKLNEMDGCYTL